MKHHLLVHENGQLRSTGPYQSADGQRRAHFEFKARGADVFYADVSPTGDLYVGRMHEEFRS